LLERNKQTSTAGVCSGTVKAVFCCRWYAKTHPGDH